MSEGAFTAAVIGLILFVTLCAAVLWWRVLTRGPS
jgi:hypothetical protein